MYRSLSFALAVAISSVFWLLPQIGWSEVTHPLLGDADSEQREGFISLDRAQASQAQEQSELEQQSILAAAINQSQILAAGLSFPTPNYTQRIGLSEDFFVAVSVSNPGTSLRQAYFLIAFTPIGTPPTDSSKTKEFYRPLPGLVPGESVRSFIIRNSDLKAGGVVPGRYGVTFAIYNEQDQGEGVFFGLPFTFGTMDVQLPTAPAIPSAIGRFENLNVDFTFTNAGDTPDRVTALLVFTPPGSTDPSASKEMYVTGLEVPPGGATRRVTLTAAQLAAAGIVPGTWLVTATAFNGADTRLQSYFGHLLTIGDVAPGFTAVPTYTPALRPGFPFQSTWRLENTGDSVGRVTLVIGITPLGATDPSATREFSKIIEVPAGGGAFEFGITGDGLARAGIGEGEYGLSFIALGGDGRKIGSGFFGNLLRIGEAQPVVTQAPAFSDRIDVGQDFTVQWQAGNSGPVSAEVTLLTVFRRVGTDPNDPKNFIEISRTGLVPPRGGPINVLISASDLARAGIVAGEHILTFILFNNANDQRIGQSFGNLLAIGQAAPAFSTLPAYNPQLVEGSDLVTLWNVGNTGPVTGDVTLVVAITQPGTTHTVEFSQNVRVPPGGGNFEFRIPWAQLSQAGVGPGRRTASFVAVDGNGNRLGSFFGKPLEILEGGTPVSFLFSQRVTAPGPTSGLLNSWKVPADDPLAGQLLDRAFVYDQAISSIALLSLGRPDGARDILEALARLEAGTGRLGFVYATGPQGRDFPAVFTGTTAWVVSALATYERQTGDGQFRPMAERLLQTLLSFKDPATGLFRGGLDADGNPFPWISTEHNLDLANALLDMAALTGRSLYAQEADSLSQAITAHLWAGNHFHNGLGDDLVVLDTQALGGIYFDRIGDVARAETALTFIDGVFKKTVQVNGSSVTGYAPFHADSFIWTEGSAFVAVLNERLGHNDFAQSILDQLEHLRDPSGGVLYSSATAMTQTPGSDMLFPAFPSVVATSWALIARLGLRFSIAVEQPLIVASVPTGDDFVASIPVENNQSVEAPVTVGVTFTPTSGSDPQTITRVFTVRPGRSFVNFRLTAGELSLLNIAPGFYRVAFSLLDALKNSIGGDFFFEALVEFLL